MAVEIKELSYTYKNSDAFALRGLSLSVGDGECIFISGANGSGKSTLVCLLAGLLPGFTGGRLDGVIEMAQTRPACVLQNIDAQLLHDTAAEEMAFYEKYSDSGALSPRQSASMFGVERIMERKTCALSSGEKQRLVLACAMQCSGGKLAVLDEPLSYLDEGGAQKLREAIASLKARAIAVIITGPQGTALDGVADRHYLLSAGRLLAVPAPQSRADAPAPSGKRGEVLLSASRVAAGKAEAGCLQPSSMELYSGEIAGLLGPNGSGKTTLARLLAGWCEPTDGVISFSGKTADCVILRKTVRLLGPNPYTGLLYASARENLRHAVQRDFQWQATARLLGAEEFLSRDIAGLSFGQAQRVALLCALAAQPKLLVLDEAASCLDPQGFEQFSSALGAFASAGGSVLIVSHLENHIRRLCSRVISMESVYATSHR